MGDQHGGKSCSHDRRFCHVTPTGVTPTGCKLNPRATITWMRPESEEGNKEELRGKQEQVFSMESILRCGYSNKHGMNSRAIQDGGLCQTD